MNLRKLVLDISRLLTLKEKISLITSLFVQSASGVLDLIGIACITYVGLVSLGKSENIVKEIEKQFSFIDSVEIAEIAGVGVIMILTKTVVSYFLTRRIFRIAAQISERLSCSFYSEILEKNPAKFKKLANDNLGTLLTVGINEMVIGFLVYTGLAINELILLSLLVIPIFVFATIPAIVNLIILLFISLIMMKYIGLATHNASVAAQSSQENRRNIVLASSKIASYLSLSGRHIFFSQKFTKSAQIETDNTAKLEVIQQVPKYVLELSITLIGLSTVLVLNLVGQSAIAIQVGVLLASISFRLLPSLIRFQGYFLYAKSKASRSNEVLEFYGSDAENPTENSQFTSSNRFLKTNNLSGVTIECQAVSFKYDGDENKMSLLNDFSHIFEANSLTLIEGKSGTGKSTLLNVLSGVTETSSGKLVFSIPPNDTLRIGYMDQQSVVFEGTLAENIALIENFNETDLELINKAVDNVGLSEFRDKTGLNNFILGRDIIPSGGELQKISLARLFFADFNVLLLDEPTSNLDRISEIKIIDLLKTAAKSKTIILVSHSLAIQDSIKCKLLMNGNSHE